MNFFKHFVDGHDSTSMIKLMNEFGIEGYGAYFILMELAIDKIKKPQDREMTEDDCRVRLHARKLREKLRMRAKKLESFLATCEALDLLKLDTCSTEVPLKSDGSATEVELQFNSNEQEFNFFFPKILESLDREAKRPRRDRGLPALKKEEEDRDEDKEGEEEGGGDFLGDQSLLSQLPEDTKSRWLNTYQNQTWIDRELKAAIQWSRDTPLKPVKNWPAFLNRWLKTEAERKPPIKRTTPTVEPVYDGTSAPPDVSESDIPPITDEERGRIIEAVKSQFGIIRPVAKASGVA